MSNNVKYWVWTLGLIGSAAVLLPPTVPLIMFVPIGFVVGFTGAMLFSGE